MSVKPTIPEIEEFYKTHKVDDDFDEIFYSSECEDAKGFYQPHCEKNGFDERHRLFYHWFFYGKKHYEKNDQIYSPPHEKLLDVDVSVVLGCKNREDMLNISIHSWINYDPIKEIIITDWSSDKSIKYLEKISPKIKIIRVDGEKYYNASKPVNIAIKQAKCPLIMKLDVDYIINPYGNFNNLIDITENEFISGDWRDDPLDNGLGFVKGTNGFLCVHKKNIEKVGYYDESIENYGFEDCKMFFALIKNGLKRKTLKFKKNDVPLYHNPHSSYFRIKEFEQKSISYNKKHYETIPLIGPDFIVAGFQKSGTSAISYNLCKHFPNHVYMPKVEHQDTKKLTYEIDFFNQRNEEKDIDWYRSLFSQHTDKICGEKAPNYSINSELSAKKIHENFPDVKLIFALRNPITRAYSAYNHFKQEYPYSKEWGYWSIEKSFIENIFDEETQSYIEHCCFLSNGLYAKHISNYLKFFDRSQMLFIVQESLSSEEMSHFEWDKIKSFLGLNDVKIENQKIHKREYDELMCEKSKELLKEYYKDHNDKLFNILGYKIEEWSDGYNVKEALEEKLKNILKQKITTMLQNMNPKRVAIQLNKEAVSPPKGKNEWTYKDVLDVTASS